MKRLQTFAPLRGNLRLRKVLLRLGVIRRATKQMQGATKMAPGMLMSVMPMCALNP